MKVPTMRSIVLATRNPGKLREIRQVLEELPVNVLGLDEIAPSLEEPEETGSTFAENAAQKARYYAQQTGQWCLADDSGLAVDALNGEPGVHSARYAADRIGNASRDLMDAANNAKLLEALKDVPDEQRTARFICHLALCDGDRIILETYDTIEGRIGHHAKGSNGFGYDPLFVADETGCTTAELPPERKNAISHRGKALRYFARLLNSVLASQKQA